MSRSFLFGGTSSSQSSSKNLVEFRAGKMTMKNSTVSADKRKGLVYVHQADDSLMHFCWKDRTTGTVEDVSFLLYHFKYFLTLQLSTCSLQITKLL